MQFADGKVIRVFVHQFVKTIHQLPHSRFAAGEVIGCEWVAWFVDVHSRILVAGLAKI